MDESDLQLDEVAIIKVFVKNIYICIYVYIYIYMYIYIMWIKVRTKNAY